VKIHNELPEKCPECGVEDYSPTRCIDGTAYDGAFEPHCQAHQPEKDPDAQSVRLICPECTHTLRISVELADKAERGNL
jgi:predicted RNA-binding Zn-ribbon protein involved in translation (DUF1610 family)